MNLKHILKHLFIPHESNNHKAKMLHPSFLIALTCLFVFNQTLLKFYALARPGVLGYSSEIKLQEIIDLTNQERQKLGLASLRINSLLSEAAQKKANDMFAFDYWAHKSPSGKEPWSFISDVGYDYKTAGENLARDFSSSGPVVKAWMNSPSHRENIVNSKFKEIGVAVVNGTLGGVQTTLVVQFFGTPVNYVENLAANDLVSTKSAVATNRAIPEKLGVNTNLVNPLQVTKTAGIFLLGMICSAVFIDGYIAYKNKIYRSAGKTVAHAGFLVAIILFVLFSQQGIIF